MIINDLDLLGSAIAPDKANSPWVVDANAMLPCPASLQRLEAIPWQCRQICQLFRLMDLPQLALCDPLNVCAQAPRETAMEQGLGIAIGEGADHRLLYTQRVLNVKRS